MVVLLVGGAVHFASADGARLWTSESGQTLEASLIEVRGGQVVLQDEDGRRFRISIGDLSRADRETLEQRSSPTRKAFEPASARFPRPRLGRVWRIWDEAPHNAFTDLIRYKGHWYCVFREGLQHRATGEDEGDGSVRIIRSAEGREWESVALLQEDSCDFRDPEFTELSSGELLVNVNVRSRKHGHTEARTWLTKNGEEWKSPLRFAGADSRGYWRWQVERHGQHVYGMAYSGRYRDGGLLRTEDGKRWTEVSSGFFPAESNARGTEAAFLFDSDGTLRCLLRRDSVPDDPKIGPPGMLGTAQPPYEDWAWTELEKRIGGPKMLRLSDGRIMAVVRLYQPERTALCQVDFEEGVLKECLELPSGGDCGYAGMVERDGELWVSYYSSHERKTSVYLAIIRL